MQHRIMTRKPFLVHMVRWDGFGLDGWTGFLDLVGKLHLVVDEDACTDDVYVAHLNGLMYVRYLPMCGELLVVGPRDRGVGRYPAYGDWVVSCPDASLILISDMQAIQGSYDPVTGS